MASATISRRERERPNGDREVLLARGDDDDAAATLLTRSYDSLLRGEGLGELPILCLRWKCDDGEVLRGEENGCCCRGELYCCVLPGDREETLPTPDVLLPGPISGDRDVILLPEERTLWCLRLLLFGDTETSLFLPGDGLVKLRLKGVPFPADCDSAGAVMGRLVKLLRRDLSEPFR